MTMPTVGQNGTGATEYTVICNNNLQLATSPSQPTTGRTQRTHTHKHRERETNCVKNNNNNGM